jgi:hypothetical protein
MTVCISGMVHHQNGSAIVMASDRMLTAGVVTADLPAVIKKQNIHDHWSAMYAGDDITHVMPVLRRVIAALLDSHNPSVGEVAEAFSRAYHEERMRLAEQRILSPYGLDMQSFMKLLAESDSDDLKLLMRRIQAAELGCTFLVCGFQGNVPRIFTVTEPGVDEDYGPVGFWSIGSGAEVAISSLQFRRFNRNMSLSLAMYLVAEAKFMSEAAMGVGRSTLISILKPGHRPLFLEDDEVNELRAMWEAEGRPRIPDNLETRIGTHLNFRPLEPRGADERNAMPSPAAERPGQPSDSETSEGQP